MRHRGGFTTPTTCALAGSGLLMPALLFVLGMSAGCQGALDARPNILVLSLDTLRADHLSLYGYARSTSPHIDALARDSIVFDHALAQAAATMWSHRSLFQSRVPSQTGPEAPTLAELLQAHGYQTVGLTDGGQVSRSFGFGRGFERYGEAKRVHHCVASALGEIGWHSMRRIAQHRDPVDRPAFEPDSLELRPARRVPIGLRGYSFEQEAERGK